MPNAYIDDVRESMIGVINRYENNNNATFQQHFECGDQVNTIYNLNGGRHDYGIPAMYRASNKTIEEVSKVWRESFQGSAVILPAQYKPLFNCYQVNFVVVTGDGRTVLNYHVSLQ